MRAFSLPAIEWTIHNDYPHGANHYSAKIWWSGDLHGLIDTPFGRLGRVGNDPHMFADADGARFAVETDGDDVNVCPWEQWEYVTGA